MYRVVLTANAKKQLKKMDRFTSQLIFNWIRKNLEGCTNPRQHGKGLTGDKAGGWRYRIGNYRIIADIQDKKIVILILTVGHRKEVYK